ncbi:MAG: SipW-dependent-type signal peptide-containing protein [Oscillospiraceae bacterium]|nr:SipW-dependent-type signal peptide-containing protein [Oscillospiraceae bacterium]
MKKTKKIVALFLAAVMLVCTTVAATVAYLTSTTEVVENTFTVGNVKITLDEAKVNDKGLIDNSASNRVTDNSYHVYPGMTYDKDPQVHVKAGSEEAYIRMQVTVSDLNALKNAFPQSKYPTWYNGDVFLLQMLVSGWDETVWLTKGFDPKTGIYEFWYKDTVDATVDIDPDTDGVQTKDIDLEPLFTNVIIPETITNVVPEGAVSGTLSEFEYLNNIKINVVAHAIQAEGFANAEAAWLAW